MRNKPLRRKTGISRAPLTTGRRSRKARKPSEFARIYHSRERVRWVKALPCVICGHGPCDNAHTENGGMGRKADYQTIVPLCCMPMEDPRSPGYYRGHHGLLHQIGGESFRASYNVDLTLAAIATEQQWQAYLARTR